MFLIKKYGDKVTKNRGSDNVTYDRVLYICIYNINSWRLSPINFRVDTRWQLQVLTPRCSRGVGRMGAIHTNHVQHIPMEYQSNIGKYRKWRTLGAFVFSPPNARQPWKRLRGGFWRLFLPFATASFVNGPYNVNHCPDNDIFRWVIGDKKKTRHSPEDVTYKIKHIQPTL